MLIIGEAERGLFGTSVRYVMKARDSGIGFGGPLQLF